MLTLKYVYYRRHCSRVSVRWRGILFWFWFSDPTILGLRPFPTYVFFFPWFFFFDSIWLFGQSWTFYARRATESDVCFSVWAHLLSERYPMQKSACPPAQFELLPTSQNLILKIWSSSKSKNRPFRTRDSFRLFFVGLCTVGKNSNCAYGEADFWAGYLSERLDWFREMYDWFPQFMGQQRTWTQKRVKIERDNIWPHRKRP